MVLFDLLKNVKIVQQMKARLTWTTTIWTITRMTAKLKATIKSCPPKPKAQISTAAAVAAAPARAAATAAVCSRI